MIVIDASVWVSALIEDDVHHEASKHWVATQLAMSQVFVVPGIFLAEVAGALSRRAGNSRWSRNVARLVAISQRFDVRDIDRELAEAAADYAATRSLRGADAIYVVLPLRLNLPLVTWDREHLRRASQDIDVRAPR